MLLFVVPVHIRMSLNLARWAIILLTTASVLQWLIQWPEGASSYYLLDMLLMFVSCLFLFFLYVFMHSIKATFLPPSVYTSGGVVLS